MAFSCGWFLQPLDLLALFAFEADNSGGWGLCADMKLFFVERFLSVSIYKKSVRVVAFVHASSMHSVTNLVGFFLCTMSCVGTWFLPSLSPAPLHKLFEVAIYQGEEDPRINA